MTTQLPPLVALPEFAPARRPATVGVTIDDREERDRRLLLRCLQVMLFAAIPLQRFGFPVGGSAIALGLLVTLATVGLMAVRGLLQVDTARLALFAVVAAAAAVSAMVNPSTASATSYLLFVALYVPFVFVTTTDRAFFLATLRTFQTLVFVCAVLGVIQFLAQFVVQSELLFTFKGLLPDAILMPGFNTAVPLTYGAALMKSNGFLLLEPSIFSQLLALALLVEILFFGRVLRLALFGLALPLSYSGTGILLLAVFLPLVVLHRRAVGLMIAGAVGVVVLIPFAGALHLDVILQRAGELQSTQTSGFARFVSAFWLLRDFVVDNTPALFFGLGPGSITGVLHDVPYEAHDPTWGKLLFEYGIVGTLVFSVFFLACVFVGAHSKWVSGFLLFGFLFFGGVLLDPRVNALLIAFCTLQRVAGYGRATEEDAVTGAER
ncbi:hypothetical protein HL658_29255 [Azospirillum sp. RWY-5-1]|uniref:O-antigen ligase domain-containing protein n=1 Tax=Azospirillum oleiclasticum TaxID=2735135 RepID=A0ABX2TMK9_9PROT|nr:hypothetical protein [Azospirillum oleiclasticum]NYZ16653.1 hypothetical protein [Azospirillum oleiclasticum]NYZ24140.1 hypothetical protein [Azospirillum oleiclasticum]